MTGKRRVGGADIVGLKQIWDGINKDTSKRYFRLEKPSVMMYYKLYKKDNR